MGSSVEQQSVGGFLSGERPRGGPHRAASEGAEASGRPVLVATSPGNRTAASVGGCAAQHLRVCSGITDGPPPPAEQIAVFPHNPSLKRTSAMLAAAA